MEIDDNGISFLKSLEALRLDPYQDPKGRWTIGWGHTDGVGSETPRINEATAESLFWDDVEPIEQFLSDPHVVLVKLTQSEFNALVCFVFNEGEEKFITSTLLKKLNQGDKIGAGKEFARWIYYHDEDGLAHESSGLVKRRAKEAALFLSDVVSAKLNAES